MKRKFSPRLTCLLASLIFICYTSNATPTNTPNTEHPKPAAQNLPSTQGSCVIICPGDFSFSLGSGECTWVVDYVIETAGDCLPSVVVQTSGLPSGSAFPIGVTQNCFTIDLPPLGVPDGDTTCCFSVTVAEFADPTPLLVCNDLTFISVDKNCQYCIGAGDVMEGGPYGCFSNYLVQLDKVAPFGNGPWVSPCVGASDIGKTYQVRVTEPVFGNKCWGNVKIEDKIPPVVECHDLSVPCTTNPDLNAHPFPAITGYQTITYKGLQDSVGQPGAVVPHIKDYIFDYSYLPANTAVLDLNCRIKLSGHSSLPDLQIIVKAPDGTTAELFTSDASCTGVVWPIDVLFDDEGTAAGQCAQLNANGTPIQCLTLGVSNPTALSAFDGKDAAGVWTLTIRDNLAPAGGIIEIAGLAISVNVPQRIPIDNCGGPVSLTRLDSKMVGDCASGFTKIIHRTWTATDASGNSSTCLQDIKFIQPTLADVVLPVSYDGIEAPFFLCSSTSDPSPAWINSQGLQGEPLMFGQPVSCTIAAAYADLVINVCDGAYKIRREWTIIDWCTAEIVLYNQIIKVVDDQGPAFVCPANLSVSTSAFACCGTADLPDVLITDNCSRISAFNGNIAIFDLAGMQTGVQSLTGSLSNFPGNDLSNPDTLGAMGATICLPEGTHIVSYFVADDCGNTNTCSFQLKVQDFAAPVAVCDEITTIAIGIDDPSDCFGPAGPNGSPAALDACHFAGVSMVNAATFDDGSYDACGNVKFTIRRATQFSDCILGLNATNGQAPCNDPFPDFPSEFERAISEQDSIKFYACEVGTVQPVILRVYQVDTMGNFVLGANGTPIFNECIIQVNVEDKIKPVCVPPANVTLACEQFNPNLSVYGTASLIDNCCLDTAQAYQGQCGLAHDVNYANFDSLCSKGTIVRIFRAFDCSGNTSQCSQRIIVNYNQDYYIRFPDDVFATVCDGINNYGEPQFFGEDCELLAKSYEDEIFTVIPDACLKIERRWSVINWCTFNPLLPATWVPNPHPNAIVNHPSNLPGPVVSACGALPPWNPTVVKVSHVDTAATNYCMFWSPNANMYQYTQIIKIIDTEDPVISNCPTGPTTYTDSTLNNPELWHNVFNPNLPVQDLKERATNLSISSSDACDGGNLQRSAFLLFLDLDNDGILESVINSEKLLGADTIRYNNVSTPGYLGGTLVTFDSRPVPLNQKWHFSFQEIGSPDTAFAAIRWNTALQPNVFVAPQLPHGTHKVKWIMVDQCGNESVCEYVFTIEQGIISAIDELDNASFALFQNEPNPFSQSTTIGFRLPHAGEATLSIYDAEGRRLFVKTDQFNQGYNSVFLEGGLLPAPSVLFYKLESGAHVAWKKMVLVR
jgi:hypothetical protein